MREGSLEAPSRRLMFELDGRRVDGELDATRENMRPEGKASAVQLLKFALAPDLMSRLKMPGT